jgi:hypothetical protein
MQNDDFLSRVHTVLLEAASSFPDGGIKGAVVGTLLRARGIEPSSHGYPKVRDLMAALEAVGKVKTGSDGKLAYTVWVVTKNSPNRTVVPAPRPLLQAEPAKAGRNVDESDLTASSRRMLRQHVYDAFISERLDKPRRIGATSGSLWIGNVPQPTSDIKWCEIQPISATEQQGWGIRFLVNKGWESEPDLVDALRGDDWYRAFPLALASKHGEIARAEWNRKRTARVVKIVDHWATENSISSDLLFEGDAGNTPKIDPSNARRMILAALSRLPTSELLKLPIPARYWLSAESKEVES